MNLTASFYRLVDWMGARLSGRPLTSGALIFALALAFFSSGLDSRPFFSRGEGREALVARDMLRLNNLILPYEDVVDLPTKPPLLQWSSIISLKLGRLFDPKESLSEWELRFPSAFFGALTLGVFFVFLTRITSVRISLLASIILGSTVEWIRSSGHARVDMGFTAFVTLCSLCIFLLLDRWRSSRLRGSFGISALLTTGIGVFGALAVLGKGPAGLAFPLLTAAAFVGVTRLSDRPGPRLGGVIVLGAVGVAIAVLLAGIWYYLAYGIGGSDFVHVHLFKENIGRFALIDGKDQGHVKPFYYSFIYLFLGFIPGSLFLPQVVRSLVRSGSELMTPANSFKLYCVLWSLVVIGIVTLSSAKRDVYLLPAFAPLAYLVADAALRSDLMRRYYGVLGGVVSVLGVVVLFGFSITVAVSLLGVLPELVPTPKKLQAARLIESLTSSFVNEPEWSIFLLISALTLLVGAGFFRKARFYDGVMAVCLGVFFITPFINHSVLPAIAAGESPKAFMEEVKQVVPQNAILYQMDRQFFSAMFYADRRVSMLKSISGDALGGNAYLLVEEDLADDVLREFPDLVTLLVSDTLAANGDEPLVLLGPGMKPFGKEIGQGKLFSGTDNLEKNEK